MTKCSCVSVLLLAVACGDSSAPGASLDSGVRNDASVDDTGDGDGDGDIQGDGDGGASDEHDASHTGDRVDPTSLLPLKVGSSWTYEVDRPLVQETGPCEKGFTREVVDLLEINGRSAYQVNASCSDMPTYYSVSDDGVDGYVIGVATDFVPVITTPLVEGATFESNHIEFEWHAVDSITVPAGTFRHCWERESTSGTSPDPKTYCPGVGLVRDDRGNSYAFVLKSYVIAK